MSAELEKVQSILHKLISETKCEDIVKKQVVIQINADQDINSACQTLVKHNISSAPVYDAFSKTYLGLIDYRDLVHYILLVAQGKRKEEDPIQTLEWDMILSKVLKGEPVKARLATDLSRCNPFYSVLPEAPLWTAIDVMRNGIHRINVVSSEETEGGYVIGVLSQTDILRNWCSHSDLLCLLTKVTLDQIPNIIHRPVFSIEENEPLIRAFSFMVDKSISSLAVINGERRLVGNVSISDVRSLFKHGSMKSLWQPCIDFISSNLFEEGLAKGKDRYPFFEVTETSSLAYVIGKLLATKTHRVWVVDADYKLSGVISMTDILNAICPLFEDSDEN